MSLRTLKEGDMSIGSLVVFALGVSEDGKKLKDVLVFCSVLPCELLVC